MVHLASVVVGILGSWVDSVLYITYPPFEPRDILRSLKSKLYPNKFLLAYIGAYGTKWSHPLGMGKDREVDFFY